MSIILTSRPARYFSLRKTRETKTTRGLGRESKTALLRYPEERERWFKFKDDRMQERALERLIDIGANLARE
jgi:hypothetical protein